MIYRALRSFERLTDSLADSQEVTPSTLADCHAAITIEQGHRRGGMKRSDVAILAELLDQVENCTHISCELLEDAQAVVNGAKALCARRSEQYKLNLSRRWMV
jgi:hypothetical protein